MTYCPREGKKQEMMMMIKSDSREGETDRQTDSEQRRAEGKQSWKKTQTLIDHQNELTLHCDREMEREEIER